MVMILVNSDSFPISKSKLLKFIRPCANRGFIKTTDHQPTDTPTTFHLATDPPTGRNQLTLKQKTKF